MNLSLVLYRIDMDIPGPVVSYNDFQGACNLSQKGGRVEYVNTGMQELFIMF